MAARDALRWRTACPFRIERTRIGFPQATRSGSVRRPLILGLETSEMRVVHDEQLSISNLSRSMRGGVGRAVAPWVAS